MLLLYVSFVINIVKLKESVDFYVKDDRENIIENFFLI